jgi:hypothetical protein
MSSVLKYITERRMAERIELMKPMENERGSTKLHSGELDLNPSQDKTK